MTAAEKTYAVDPKRLARGAWCHKRSRQIGEGDISASYSADRIGQSKQIRKPFRHDGATWVCVGGNGASWSAYKLVHPSTFDGQSFTYTDSHKYPHPDLGFYHGMIVTHAKSEWVLCGPEARFIEGESEQMSLF